MLFMVLSWDIQLCLPNYMPTYDYDIQVHKGDIICLRCSKVGFGSHNGAKVWSGTSVYTVQLNEWGHLP